VSRCDGTFRLEAGYDGFTVTLICPCGWSEELDTLDQLFTRRFRAFLRRHGVGTRVVEGAWEPGRLLRFRRLRNA
jgi:hypothetical protein